MNDIIIPERLAAEARKLSIPDSLASDLLAAYAPYAVSGGEIKARVAAEATITPDIARRARLDMAKVRTGADKRRKELKADSLLRGKAIDGLCAMVELEASAFEKQMEEIEKAAERAEAARVAKLRDDRLAQLRPYVSDPSMYQVERMTDEAFAELVESSRLAAEARAKAKADADRLAAENAEADRLAAEKAAAERLETAKREAAEKARMEAERAAEAKSRADAQAAADALAASARREQAAKDAAAKAEAAAVAEKERARLAAEAQAKRIEQMEEAARRTRLLEEQEAREAEARAEARRKKQAEDRASVIGRITATLAELKKSGRIGSMRALAELIVDGQLAGVTVDWDAA